MAEPIRCFGAGDPLYERYHDEEWGRPVVDEDALFERLTLEAFQSGLSWITILRKREGFRRAFFDFQPERVAEMDASDVDRLLSDPAIVRNRAKVEATLANARALVDLHASGGSLSSVIWAKASWESPALTDFGSMAPFTDDAKALAKELKSLGFRFVGPTTAYSTMEAVGVVNDHLATCHVRDEVERERSALKGSLPADPAGSMTE